MFAAISASLQSPKDEAERIIAYGELKQYILENPTDVDALNLYEKYSRRFESVSKPVSPRP